MYQESIRIDLDKLRSDMRDICMGAYFMGGFGGALVEAFDVDRASPEQLVELAQREGVDLEKYRM